MACSAARRAAAPITISVGLGKVGICANRSRVVEKICSAKSRGYCLEMICADFLAGAHIENGDPKILLLSMLRLFRFLPAPEKQQFLNEVTNAA